MRDLSFCSALLRICLQYLKSMIVVTVNKPWTYETRYANLMTVHNLYDGHFVSVMSFS